MSCFGCAYYAETISLSTYGSITIKICARYRSKQLSDADFCKACKHKCKLTGKQKEKSNE